MSITQNNEKETNELSLNELVHQGAEAVRYFFFYCRS